MRCSWHTCALSIDEGVVCGPAIQIRNSTGLINRQIKITIVNPICRALSYEYEMNLRSKYSIAYSQVLKPRIGIPFNFVSYLGLCILIGFCVLLD